jgi:hypothetical protein
LKILETSLLSKTILVFQIKKQISSSNKCKPTSNIRQQEEDATKPNFRIIPTHKTHRQLFRIVYWNHLNNMFSSLFVSD